MAGVRPDGNSLVSLGDQSDDRFVRLRCSGSEIPIASSQAFSPTTHNAQLMLADLANACGACASVWLENFCSACKSLMPDKADSTLLIVKCCVTTGDHSSCVEILANPETCPWW